MARPPRPGPRPSPERELEPGHHATIGPTTRFDYLAAVSPRWQRRQNHNFLNYRLVALLAVNLSCTNWPPLVSPWASEGQVAELCRLRICDMLLRFTLWTVSPGVPLCQQVSQSSPDGWSKDLFFFFFLSWEWGYAPLLLIPLIPGFGWSGGNLETSQEPRA